MIVFLYLYIFIVFHPFLGQNLYIYHALSFFRGIPRWQFPQRPPTRHSRELSGLVGRVATLGLLDAAWSTVTGYKNLGCLGTKKTAFPHGPKRQKVPRDKHQLE